VKILCSSSGGAQEKRKTGRNSHKTVKMMVRVLSLPDFKENSIYIHELLLRGYSSKYSLLNLEISYFDENFKLGVEGKAFIGPQIGDQKRVECFFSVFT
jgi:hypothetical protein